MKLWTLSTVSVAVFLTYSVTQYSRESAALHQEATASERIPKVSKGSKARKAIDKSCLSSELVMRKQAAEPQPFIQSTAAMASAIR